MCVNYKFNKDTDLNNKLTEIGVTASAKSVSKGVRFLKVRRNEHSENSFMF